MDLGAYQERAGDEVAARADLLQEVAVFLYEHPEPGLAEHRASAFLTQTLADMGFAVETGLAGMPTAFRARWGAGGPVVALMAEYDALPGIGHGCGHNLIAATAVAAAGALTRVVDFPFTLTVLGTPAEETVGGKIAMAEAGCFDGVDLALIAHPGVVTRVGGASWASHPLEITFHGRAAHAGANPQAGINALDALVQTYVAMRALRIHLRDDVRMPGIITHGGDAPNIVPERASARFSLRAADWRYLEEVVIPRVRDCARGAALATGATVAVEHYEPLFRETLQLPALVSACLAYLDDLGADPRPPAPGAGGGVTDVGNVSWVVPTLQFGFSISGPGEGLAGHTRAFADATIAPTGQSGALMAAKTLAWLALRFALDSDFREVVTEEFRVRRIQA